MAVFTVLNTEQITELLQAYTIGSFVALHPIESGIENTNYFLDTTEGHYVLTVFEVLQFEQLPFYIQLMDHLARQGVPVPAPAHRQDGQLISIIANKPAIIASRLNGKSVLNPSITECQMVARTQAQAHLAARNYTIHQANLRGLSWWLEKWPTIQPFLSPEQQALYQTSLTEQIEVQQSSQWQQLPAGACHCDLFRDNVLINGSTMGGIIDFYFAGCDKWLFDVAVAVNDWCVERPTGRLDPLKTQAWLQAYHAVRPFTADERQLWPVVLRAAALRFWTSRLFDFYCPRPAQNLQPHDPAWFECILRDRWQTLAIPLPQ